MALRSTRIRLRLPANKGDKTTLLMDSVVKRRKVTLRDLQSLVGFLSLDCLVVPPARAFLKLLINYQFDTRHRPSTLFYDTLSRSTSWPTFLATFSVHI